jgi:hypothetical protein
MRARSGCGQSAVPQQTASVSVSCFGWGPLKPHCNEQSVCGCGAGSSEAALTSTSLSGALPSFGPRPLGGPVRDAYALRFFLTGVLALVTGGLLLFAPRVTRLVAASASEGGGETGWRLRLLGVVGSLC